jgi:hypothetical protein
VTPPSLSKPSKSITWPLPSLFFSGVGRAPALMPARRPPWCSMGCSGTAAMSRCRPMAAGHWPPSPTPRSSASRSSAGLPQYSPVRHNHWCRGQAPPPVSAGAPWGQRRGGASAGGDAGEQGGRGGAGGRVPGARDVGAGAEGLLRHSRRRGDACGAHRPPGPPDQAGPAIPQFGPFEWATSRPKRGAILV